MESITHITYIYMYAHHVFLWSFQQIGFIKSKEIEQKEKTNVPQNYS